MASITQYPHISIDSDGAARIEGSRYKVAHLAAEHYHYGWSADELLRQHPDLKPEEVYAALTWFYDHYDEVVEQVKASAKLVESLRSGKTLSREELLRRRRSS